MLSQRALRQLLRSEHSHLFKPTTLKRFEFHHKNMSSSASKTPGQANEIAVKPDEPASQPLPLPEPLKGESTKLSVSGEGVKLDHLGPLVVNEDGTMSRISNWAEMSQIERDNTLRILGKRNQLRLKKLREGAPESQS